MDETIVKSEAAEESFWREMLSDKNKFKKIGYVVAIATTLGVGYIYEGFDRTIGSTALNLFASLVGSIATVFFFVSVYKNHQERQLARHLYALLRNEKLFETIAHNAADVVHEGVMKVISAKSPISWIESVRNEMENARPDSTITIVDSWLFQDQPDFLISLRKGVESALKNGATIRFIFMHPNTPMLQRREQFLGSVPFIKGKIEGSINEVSGYFADWTKGALEGDRKLKQIEVHLVDTYLSMQVYALDNVLYAGYYAAGATSANGPHLMISKAAMLGVFIDAYVKRIEKLSLNPSYGETIDLRARARMVAQFPANQITSYSVLPCQAEDIKNFITILKEKPNQNSSEAIQTLLVESYRCISEPANLGTALGQLNSMEKAILRRSLESTIENEETKLDALHAKDGGLAAQLNGEWFGYHRTFKEIEGEVDSVHLYDLHVVKNIERDGHYKVKGGFKEIAPMENENLPPEKAYSFDVVGCADHHEVCLTAIRGGEVSTCILQIYLGADDRVRIMIGIYLFHDYERSLRVTPIILSKVRLNPEDAYQQLSRTRFRDVQRWTLGLPKT